MSYYGLQIFTIILSYIFYIQFVGYTDQQKKGNLLPGTYCHVPARWGLQQTTLAPDSDKTRAQGSFGRNTDAKYLDRANLVTNYQKLKKTDRTLDPFY